MKQLFEQIYKENSKFIYNVALSILRNKKDAEDVMQDVFIKFFENIYYFKGKSAIKTYLYRITVNNCIDFIRKEQIKIKKIELINEKYQKKEKDDIVLYDLIEKLNTNERIIISLAEIAGFSYKEIAQILNIKIGTVKSRINRTINKLKNFVLKEEKWIVKK